MGMVGTSLLTCITLWLYKRDAPGLSLERRGGDEGNVKQFSILHVGPETERDSALREGPSKVRGWATRGGWDAGLRALNNMWPGLW